MVYQLICALEAAGEGGAAALVAKLGSKAENARELCCRLYTLCERKNRAAETLSYNSLVQSRPEIVRLAGKRKDVEMKQGGLKNCFRLLLEKGSRRTFSRRSIDLRHKRGRNAFGRCLRTLGQDIT